MDTYNTAFFDILVECGPDPYCRAFATVGDNPDELVNVLREHEADACQPPDDAQADLAQVADQYKLGV